MTEHYGPQYSGPEYLRRSFEPHLGSTSDDSGAIYSLPEPSPGSDHFKIENDGSFPSRSADAFAIPGTAPDAFGYGHMMGLHPQRGMMQSAPVQSLVPQARQPGGDDLNAPPVGQSSWSALMKQMVHGR
jgi:hypothetical protein